MSQLLATPEGVAVVTPYHAAFVTDLKFTVPASERSWQAATKRWLVSPKYAPAVADLIQQYFGETVAVPTAIAAAPSSGIHLVQMLYLGRCKADSRIARGFADGAWSLVFPEAVLREWFNDTEESTTEAEQPKSLYAVLGIKKFSDFATIKTAYRRMAKIWHPDVNREESAPEQFRAIQNAYQVLGDDKARRKYDVGLVLEERFGEETKALARRQSYYHQRTEYRAPFTSGLIMVTATSRLGLLHVEKIHEWQDILNAEGKTMVSSWPSGNDTFEVNWV